jgi:hypothetical protein
MNALKLNVWMLVSCSMVTGFDVNNLSIQEAVMQVTDIKDKVKVEQQVDGPMASDKQYYLADEPTKAYVRVGITGLYHR